MSPRFRRSITGPLLALVVFSGVLFAVDTNQHDLWPPDEPRYAQVAREMLESGDWLTLRVNGEPYLEKPPLFFWAIAIVSAPFGDVNEMTVRIPSILSGIGTVVLTYLIAARLFGRRTAWWTGIILCTTMRFFWQARTAQIDMLLTLYLTLALLAFCIHRDTKQPRWLVVLYGAIAAAIYAKGPVGVLFPLPMVFTFHWGQRDERRHNDPDDKKRAYFEKYDLGKIHEIEAKEIPYWYPPHRMMNVDSDTEPWGDEWRPGRDFRTVAELFTKRNLWALA